MCHFGGHRVLAVKNFLNLIVQWSKHMVVKPKFFAERMIAEKVTIYTYCIGKILLMVAMNYFSHI